MKKQTILLRIPFLFFTLFALLPAFHAAEIRLKSEPFICMKTLVMLGDVAEIIPGTNETNEVIGKLRQTVLFTAPPKGEKRTADQIELRDILSRLGYSSLRHQLTGATQIVVAGDPNSSHPAIAPASYTYEKTATNFINPVVNITSNRTPSNIAQSNFIQSNPARSNSVSSQFLPPEKRIINPLRKETILPQLVKTLEKQISEALVVYLNHSTVPQFGKADNHRWKVTVKLSQEQVRLLATSGQIEEIFGGTNPPVGTQRFNIRMQGLDPATLQNVVVTVEALVELPQQVVVLRRSLPKGYIIGESDVMLKYVDDLKDENFFVSVAEVVGQETTSSVRELNVLTSGMIKKPTWVYKGDIVTVRLLNNGISVRTEGIARSDGVQGDTIPIETINANPAKRGRPNSKGETSTFLARVCEPKTVEVFASGVIVE